VPRSSSASRRFDEYVEDYNGTLERWQGRTRCSSAGERGRAPET
jgi:hypothetical protein